MFPDDDEIISGGNFHGQPPAVALDFAAIATAELGNISERRVEQLVNPALQAFHRSSYPRVVFILAT